MRFAPPAARGVAVRIVLDTNVVLSALFGRGAPFRLLSSARQREPVTLVTSLALLEELVQALERPAPAMRLAAVDRTPRQVLADYVGAVSLVTPRAVPPIVAADPDDDHVIAVAVAAAADLIVSGDRHLLALGAHGAIRIVTPTKALAAIGG